MSQNPLLYLPNYTLFIRFIQPLLCNSPDPGIFSPLHISFRNKSFTLHNTQDLDSCLKNKLPNMTLPVVDLETFADMSPEYRRAIIVIMDKYRLPVVSERDASSGNRKFGAAVKRSLRND